jgi:hypothetical protein
MAFTLRSGLKCGTCESVRKDCLIAAGCDSNKPFNPDCDKTEKKKCNDAYNTCYKKRKESLAKRRNAIIIQK